MGRVLQSSALLVAVTGMLLSMSLPSPAAVPPLLYSSPEGWICTQIPILEPNGGPARYFILGNVTADSFSVFRADDFTRVAGMYGDFGGVCDFAGIGIWCLGDVDASGRDNLLLAIPDGAYSGAPEHERWGNVVVADLTDPMTVTYEWRPEWEPDAPSYAVRYVGATAGSNDLRLMLNQRISDTQQQMLVYSFGPATAAVERSSGPVGKSLQLRQNAPNPFLGGTTIHYELGEPGVVRLRIFDVAGRLVRATPERKEPAGARAFRWDGTADTGARVSPGTYFYELSVDGRSQTRRMVLLR